MSLPYTAPTPALTVELEEVRADAAALADVFSQLNAPLPKEFPKEAVIELASALHKLPNGTARGCLRPLNEAQSQLAAIRSQYIRHDVPDDPWERDRPPLFRGEPVDQRLRSLMSSVSTALQTANRLAAEEPETEAPELGVEPPNDASASQLIERSSKAQRELEGEKAELDSLHIKSDSADTLSRRLTDAVVLNQLGRGELRLPRIVSARLRRIANALRDYPALLQKAAELITVGTHFADYTHEKWSALETRIFQAGTATIREIADDISTFAKRLDTGRKVAETQPNKTDFDLEEAAKRIHSGQPLPIHWREQVIYLPLGNRRLKSLAPLAGLSNLREFRKPSVRVRDTSPLAELVSLEALNLDHTAVSNLVPLSSLFKLRKLGLDNTLVSSLEAISALTNLQEISFSNTKVSDLSPLAKLTNLRSLRAMKAPISDLKPLAALKNLEYLDLDSTEISDLIPLRDLHNLQVLDLRAAKNLTKLDGLSRLLKLKRLYLSETNVNDLGPIAALRSLESLDLSGTQISDLEPLSWLTQLNFLDLSGTAIEDIRPLSSLPDLQWLLLNKTPLCDLHPLSVSSNLISLSIAGSKVSDLEPLTRISSLRYLTINKELEANLPAELKARKVDIQLVDPKDRRRI